MTTTLPTWRLLAEGYRVAGVDVWAYCLMPNHVHLILIPSDEDRLRAARASGQRNSGLLRRAHDRWRYNRP